MDSSLTKLKALGARMSWPVRAAALMGVMVLAWIAVAAFAFWHGGSNEVLVASFTGVICLAVGQAALLIASLFNQPQNALVGVLAGMMLRMLLPLGICFAMISRGGWMVENGLTIYMVVFYLVGLAFETLLVLPAQVSNNSGLPR